MGSLTDGITREFVITHRRVSRYISKDLSKWWRINSHHSKTFVFEPNTCTIWNNLKFIERKNPPGKREKVIIEYN